MKNYYWLVFLLLFSSVLSGQASYTSMTEKALSTMWKAEDSIGYRTALSLYEAAFAKYPDSIDHLGLYKASVLAGELNELDKAFKYLGPVYEVEKDEYGTPGWAYVVGEYSSSEYKNLLEDPRWKQVQGKAMVRKEAFFQQLEQQQQEFVSTGKGLEEGDLDGEALYRQLKNYKPYLAKNQRNYSIALSVNDTASTSYFVHLPENYTPERKYPMLIFLHGAVRYNDFADYQTQSILSGWNRFYTELADKHEVILVFPSGSKQFNWMIPDDGFFLIPSIVKEIKQCIHIDDNKVFVTGHSNGATGSFSYLMKQPTLFAGFYGFNTYPKVFTGGTFIENILNRSFINFSTDQDYYYPPEANDKLKVMMENLSADYKEYRYDGFPHWFPAFDESKPAHELLYADLLKRERNPLPSEISWEFDDDQYGAMDWIGAMKLDTLAKRAAWHQALNFNIDKWLDYDDRDSLVVKEVDEKAFDFPRKSGKVEAKYQNNTFHIKTSCLASLSINISPEMVDMNQKVKVFVNGKLYYEDKVQYDRNYMLSSFKANLDREQLWVDKIELRL